MNIKALDESSNLIEYFVHTEDIRRAVDRWAPRALDEAYSDALWDELIKRAAILYRGVDLGIVLVRPVRPAARGQARTGFGGDRRRARRTADARPRPDPPCPGHFRRPARRRRAAPVRRSRPLTNTCYTNAGPLEGAPRSCCRGGWGSADFEACVADGLLDLGHHVVRAPVEDRGRQHGVRSGGNGRREVSRLPGAA